MPSSRARRVVALSAATLALAGTAGPAVASTGVDVSPYQHPQAAAVAWDRLRAAGTQFVFIKATEGPSWVNPWLRGDWTASAEAGLLHGAYHFARPSRGRGSAAAQARLFVRSAGRMRNPGELPPVLDIETTGGLRPRALIGWVRTWLRTVQALTGRRAIIYSYPKFWATAMAGTRAFRGYPLWGACYCGHATTFGGAWRSWTFWQSSAWGRVDGVPGLVDVNQFSGSDADLAALANGAAPAPAAPAAPAPTPSPTGDGGTPQPTPSGAPLPTPAPTGTTIRSPSPAPAPTGPALVPPTPAQSDLRVG